MSGAVFYLHPCHPRAAAAGRKWVTIAPMRAMARDSRSCKT